jgi:hypothetical protein
MKKYLLVAAMIFGFGSAFAQHTATLTGNANFKNTTSGLVRLEVMLDANLTEQEVADAFQWLEDNDGYCVLEVDQKNVAISFVAEFANRDTFGKVLHLMNIETFVMNEGNGLQYFTREQLFHKFNM